MRTLRTIGIDSILPDRSHVINSKARSCGLLTGTSPTSMEDHSHTGLWFGRFEHQQHFPSDTKNGSLESSPRRHICMGMRICAVHAPPNRAAIDYSRWTVL